MPQNRLKLDFSLESAEDRNSYIQNYIQSPDFPVNPSSYELEVMGDYLLWGKDKSGVPEAETANVHLKTHWDSNPNLQSLDELLDSPTFDENQIRRKNAPIYKTPREVFSRSQTRQTAPAALLPVYEQLWRRIDETDLLVEEYELLHGRRTKEVRDSLLAKFSEEELAAIKNKAAAIDQYTYLKRKRDLKEMRSEQYTIRDTHQSTIQRHAPDHYSTEVCPTLGAEYRVEPLGLDYGKEVDRFLFAAGTIPNPFELEASLEKAIAARLWRREETGDLFFDFRDPSHLYQLLQMYGDLEDAAAIESAEGVSYAAEFWNTFLYYRSIANLSPLLEDILDMKSEHMQNAEVAARINKKYGKTYSANYISTLCCKTALGQIAEAATYHREVVENIFYPENFKKCIDCGQVFLLSKRNFMKKSKSKSGFSPRCKACEKIKRDAAAIRYAVL